MWKNLSKLFELIIVISILSQWIIHSDKVLTCSDAIGLFVIINIYRRLDKSE